ncbi:hypothetical protein HBB16_08200 [Pseudonocardia sp. MCCB 268]|nr:hypothetical protein [Pseudonocardia cytotoxica]
MTSEASVSAGVAAAGEAGPVDVLVTWPGSPSPAPAGGAGAVGLGPGPGRGPAGTWLARWPWAGRWRCGAAGAS